MKGGALVGILLSLWGATSCREASTTAIDTPDARESPQASAVPAPLANAPTTTSSATPLGVITSPLRSDERLVGEAGGREPLGYTLSAAFHMTDLVGPPRAPEVNATGIDAARKRTDLRLAIDLTPSRMRMSFVGTGFVLPPETELRARLDRLGHVVVWPGGASYRPLPPGSLRALLGERRFDVAPTTTADLFAREEPGKRIGIKTRRFDVTSRAAKAAFEIGKLEGLGEGGTLLCRMLLDLMNAPPSTPLCSVDEAPVRAELAWIGHGVLTFELTGVLQKKDVPAIGVPPPAASYASTAPPASAVHPMLTPSELSAFRTGPLDPPPGGQDAGESLVVWNPTDQLRVLYIDGVPAAWAAPGARDSLIGLQRGRYSLQWRTFLGDVVDTSFVQSVPGLVEVGNADAGSR